MASTQVMFLVQPSIMAGGKLRYVVRLQVGGDVAQRAANNLFDLPRVQVNTRPEFRHIGRRNWCSRRPMQGGFHRGWEIHEGQAYLIARDSEMDKKFPSPQRA